MGFNVPDLDDRRTSSILVLMETLNLRQLNNTTSLNGILLDLVLTNLDVEFTVAHDLAPFLNEDPHHPALSILINLDLPSDLLNIPSNTNLRYNFRKVEVPVLCSELGVVDWDALLDHGDVDCAVQIFYNRLYTVLDHCVPKIKSTNRHCLLSWDVNDCLIDLEKELAIITEQAPEGEEARYGERLIQYASENLVTEVLIHPAVSTLAQCVRNLLSSFTRHRHIIHAGYTFAANGSWILQDGTFSYTDFAEAFHEIEVQRVIKAYENSISVDLHCSPEGDWTRLPKESFTKSCKVRVNPVDVLTSGSPSITNFLNYISPFLVPTDVETLLECSDVVGNIRFSHPTLYIFPGGQGDAALFGINGFNMLLDGGFSRKACFWDFVRHLDRLDAVLLTRLNNGNICGISSVLRRKMQNALYPQLGHFFCNVQERKSILSPDGDKDKDPLLISLLDEGQELITNLKKLNLTPQMCYRDTEPINLYHKVGHGTLDMYVLSPAKDSKEVKDFLHRWNTNDQKLFANQKSIKDFQFPLQNMVSICALLIWQPANPNDNITRILYPGSTPQQKIFEGLDKLKNLEYIKYPVCSESKLVTSSSIIALKTKQLKDASLEKLIQPDPKRMEKIRDKPPKSGEIKSRIENKLVENLEKIEVNGVSSENEIEKTVKKSDSTDSDKSVKSTKQKKIDEKIDEKKPKPKESKPKPKVDSKVDKKKAVSEKKASPTTPKKTIEPKVNGEMKEKEKPTHKPIKYSPSSTPAKSAKEATNRKVIESKNKMAAKKEPKALTEKKDTKPERKPISRRSKEPSPTTKTASSPIKKMNGVQKPDIIKKAKLDKEATTDSSTVSTPSADQKELVKLTSEEIEQLKAQELADLKEEQEVVKEIEAVFRKGESEKDTDTTLRKVKDISLEDKSEPDEYLIIEKEEVEHDSLDDKDTKEDETQKHARDSEESEKMRKLSDEIKISPKEKEELKKQESEEIIADLKDKEDKEKPTETPKEISVTSPEDKIDTSIDKKIADAEQNIALESQPDERYSATVESGATTAPTLPEDERITLDEIKEDNGDQVIEEKHVKEDTKEKDVPVIQLPTKAFEAIPKLPPVVGIRLDKQSHIRDIVKTPDEVADLPVHEEADIDQYHIDVMKSNIKSEDIKMEMKPQEKIEADVKEEKDKDTTIKEIKGEGEISKPEEKGDKIVKEKVGVIKIPETESKIEKLPKEQVEQKIEKPKDEVARRGPEIEEVDKKAEEAITETKIQVEAAKDSKITEGERIEKKVEEGKTVQKEIIEETKTQTEILEKYEIAKEEKIEKAKEEEEIKPIEKEAVREGEIKDITKLLKEPAITKDEEIQQADKVEEAKSSTDEKMEEIETVQQEKIDEIKAQTVLLKESAIIKDEKIKEPKKLEDTKPILEEKVEAIKASEEKKIEGIEIQTEVLKEAQTTKDAKIEDAMEAVESKPHEEKEVMVTETVRKEKMEDIAIPTETLEEPEIAKKIEEAKKVETAKLPEEKKGQVEESKAQTEILKEPELIKDEKIEVKDTQMKKVEETKPVVEEIAEEIKAFQQEKVEEETQVKSEILKEPEIKETKPPEDGTIKEVKVLDEEKIEETKDQTEVLKEPKMTKEETIEDTKKVGETKVSQEEKIEAKDQAEELKKPEIAKDEKIEEAKKVEGTRLPADDKVGEAKVLQEEKVLETKDQIEDLKPEIAKDKEIEEAKEVQEIKIREEKFEETKDQIEVLKDHKIIEDKKIEEGKDVQAKIPEETKYIGEEKIGEKLEEVEQVKITPIEKKQEPKVLETEKLEDIKSTLAEEIEADEDLQRQKVLDAKLSQDEIIEKIESSEAGKIEETESSQPDQVIEKDVEIKDIKSTQAEKAELITDKGIEHKTKEEEKEKLEEIKKQATDITTPKEIAPIEKKTDEKFEEREPVHLEAQELAEMKKQATDITARKEKHIEEAAPTEKKDELIEEAAILKIEKVEEGKSEQIETKELEEIKRQTTDITAHKEKQTEEVESIQKKTDEKMEEGIISEIEKVQESKPIPVHEEEPKEIERQVTDITAHKEKHVEEEATKKTDEKVEEVAISKIEKVEEKKPLQVEAEELEEIKRQATDITSRKEKHIEEVTPKRADEKIEEAVISKIEKVEERKPVPVGEEALEDIKGQLADITAPREKHIEEEVPKNIDERIEEVEKEKPVKVEEEELGEIERQVSDVTALKEKHIEEEAPQKPDEKVEEKKPLQVEAEELEEIKRQATDITSRKEKHIEEVTPKRADEKIEEVTITKIEKVEEKKPVQVEAEELEEIKRQATHITARKGKDIDEEVPIQKKPDEKIEEALISKIEKVEGSKPVSVEEEEPKEIERQLTDVTARKEKHIEEETPKKPDEKIEAVTISKIEKVEERKPVEVEAEELEEIKRQETDITAPKEKHIEEVTPKQADGKIEEAVLAKIEKVDEKQPFPLKERKLEDADITAPKEKQIEEKAPIQKKDEKITEAVISKIDKVEEGRSVEVEPEKVEEIKRQTTDITAHTGKHIEEETPLQKKTEKVEEAVISKKIDEEKPVPVEEGAEQEQVERQVTDTTIPKDKHTEEQAPKKTDEKVEEPVISKIEKADEEEPVKVEEKQLKEVEREVTDITARKDKHIEEQAPKKADEEIEEPIISKIGKAEGIEPVPVEEKKLEEIERQVTDITIHKEKHIEEVAPMKADEKLGEVVISKIEKERVPVEEKKLDEMETQVTNITAHTEKHIEEETPLQKTTDEKAEEAVISKIEKVQIKAELEEIKGQVTEITAHKEKHTEEEAPVQKKSDEKVEEVIISKIEDVEPIHEEKELDGIRRETTDITARKETHIEEIAPIEKKTDEKLEELAISKIEKVDERKPVRVEEEEKAKEPIVDKTKPSQEGKEATKIVKEEQVEVHAEEVQKSKPLQQEEAKIETKTLQELKTEKADKKDPEVEKVEEEELTDKECQKSKDLSKEKPIMDVTPSEAQTRETDEEIGSSEDQSKDIAEEKTPIQIKDDKEVTQKDITEIPAEEVIEKTPSLTQEEKLKTVITDIKDDTPETAKASSTKDQLLDGIVADKIESEITKKDKDLKQELEECIIDNEAKLPKMERQESEDSSEVRDVTFYIGDQKLEKTKPDQKDEKFDSKEQEKSKLEEKDIDDKQKQVDERDSDVISQIDAKPGEKKADDSIQEEKETKAGEIIKKDDFDKSDKAITDDIVAASSSFHTVYDSNKYANGIQQQIEVISKTLSQDKCIMEDEKGTKEIAEQKIDKEEIDVQDAAVLNGKSFKDIEDKPIGIDDSHKQSTEEATKEFAAKPEISDTDKAKIKDDVKSVKDEKIPDVTSTAIAKKETPPERIELFRKEAQVDDAKSGSQTESPETSSEQALQTFKENEILDKMELGRKSPKEREEDVAKIVASVAEVLKSDAPLEEFEVSDVSKAITESKIEPESVAPEKDEPKETKLSSLMRDSKELIEATSKMISEIKSSKIDEPKGDADTGTVHRMLVTTSSEDGGEEIEICPKGTITFSKSSESSGRSSPDQSQSKLPDLKVATGEEKADLEYTEKEKGSGKSTPKSGKTSPEIKEQSSTSDSGITEITKPEPQSIPDVKDASDEATPDAKGKPSTTESDRKSSDSGRSTPETAATKVDALAEPTSKIAFDSGRSSPDSKSIDDSKQDDVKSIPEKSALDDKSSTISEDTCLKQSTSAESKQDAAMEEAKTSLTEVSEPLSSASESKEISYDPFSKAKPEGQKGMEKSLTDVEEKKVPELERSIFSGISDMSGKSTPDATQSIISGKSSPDMKPDSGSITSRASTPGIKETIESIKGERDQKDLLIEKEDTSTKTKDVHLESVLDEIPPSYEDLDQTKSKTIEESQYDTKQTPDVKIPEKEVYMMKDEEDNIVKKEVEIAAVDQKIEGETKQYDAKEIKELEIEIIEGKSKDQEVTSKTELRKSIDLEQKRESEKIDSFHDIDTDLDQKVKGLETEVKDVESTDEKISKVVSEVETSTLKDAPFILPTKDTQDDTQGVKLQTTDARPESIIGKSDDIVVDKEKLDKSKEGTEQTPKKLTDISAPTMEEKATGEATKEVKKDASIAPALAKPDTEIPIEKDSKCIPTDLKTGQIDAPTKSALEAKDSGSVEPKEISIQGQQKPTEDVEIGGRFDKQSVDPKASESYGAKEDVKETIDKDEKIQLDCSEIQEKEPKGSGDKEKPADRSIEANDLSIEKKHAHVEEQIPKYKDIQVLEAKEINGVCFEKPKGVTKTVDDLKQEDTEKEPSKEVAKDTKVEEKHIPKLEEIQEKESIDHLKQTPHVPKQTVKDSEQKDKDLSASVSDTSKVLAKISEIDASKKIEQEVTSKSVDVKKTSEIECDGDKSMKELDGIKKDIIEQKDQHTFEKESAKIEEPKSVETKPVEDELGSSKSPVIVDDTKTEDGKRSTEEKPEPVASIKTETSVIEKTVKDLDVRKETFDKGIKDAVRVFIESEKDVSVKGPTSSIASSSKDLTKPDESTLSGKSTPDIADVERDKHIQETLTYEKHIPGTSTPPTVPVSPVIKDVHADIKSDISPEKKTEATVREQEIRSYTPASDEYEHGVSSTHSDISVSQMSRAPNLLEGDETRESDEDDMLGSPTSVTSQIGHSPSSQYDFDEDKRLSKTDQMSVSVYGTLPGDTEDSGFKSGRFLDESDLDFEKAMQEHRQVRGEDLTGEPSSYLYEITTAKYGSGSKDEVGPKTDIMTSSFIGTELPSRSTADATKEKDPIGAWGKPLSLPSPAPPDNKGTPKKEKKLPANVTAKNKLNDDKKRSESPSKYDKKKKTGSAIYVDLTYVPHHGNSNYSYVDFFKRIRARYYVFSGIEPSKEVYNALLEAKQTWEDKELEVTIIPTYDTDVLGYWVAENEELLTKYKIDLSPSASRCTINLQDHETSCSAYRLEF
ncbi:futsch [Trypoxylus dichotomus]